MIRKFDRKNKDYWWVIPSEIPRLHASALVPLACVSDNYMQMRSCVWRIFRRECGREDLSGVRSSFSGRCVSDIGLRLLVRMMR